MKWISVEERLPEDFVRVLTCDNLDHIHIMSHHYLAKYPFNIGPDDYRFYPVTHWMPLPEPAGQGSKE